MADTAKVIVLRGNPKNPESAEHIIKFPGGSISVCRTSNNEYWAHIAVHKGDVIDDLVVESANGALVDARVDYDFGSSIGRTQSIPQLQDVNHIAVRIAIDN